MKKCIFLAAILCSGMIFAQETNPTLEIVGQKVKATYHFENGNVHQQGLFKNGKLDGVWTSYDTNGNKKAIGNYDNGVKTGKWFFWNGNNLSEVDYSNSKIASVKKWNRDTLVNKQ